jgi:hypothetical protein
MEILISYVYSPMSFLNKLFVFFFLFVFIGGYAQSGKEISIPLMKNGDTTYCWNWIDGLESDLDLPHLIDSKDSINFRFWMSGQAIDIWTPDNKTYYGKITNYTKSYESYNMEKQTQKASKTYYNQTLIDTALARKVAGLYQSIIFVPSEDSIKGWSSGFDGVIYVFETSTSSNYSFKKYWTPAAQDSTLKEARQIQAFVENIYAILGLENEYEKFFQTLAPGAYTYDDFRIMTKPTARQRKKWERYEKRHPEK